MKNYFLAFTLIFILLASGNLQNSSAQIEAPRVSSVMFIENVGQWADDARFQARGGPAGAMWPEEEALLASQAPFVPQARTVQAYRASVPPVIDGNLAEWSHLG